jgi:hypothetical protein
MESITQSNISEKEDSGSLGRSFMSWSTNDKEEITFTPGEYRLAFDPSGMLPTKPSNLETMETLIHSLRRNPFQSRAGYCFAFGLVRLIGKDHTFA